MLASEYGLVIDGGNGVWPQAITDALPAFRQGSLVARPPFFYQADTEQPIWIASRQAPDRDRDALVEVDPEDRPPFGLITSQSCDVDEEGDNRKPWVQVAPVYELAEDDNRLNLAHMWRVYYLAPVPTLGNRWVGDLRIEVPVEKSWLVGRANQDAYSDQGDFDRFSDLLAAYRGRRALATSVHDLVIRPLGGFLRNLAKDAPERHLLIQRTASELFIEVAGDHLKPTAVGLVFISDVPWPPGAVQDLEGWWEAEIEEIAEPFSTTPNRYLLANDATLAELRRWIPIDLARLGPS